MPRRPKQRQCQRCGRQNAGSEKACVFCGTSLIKPRWRMTKDKIAYCHTLAKEKGLDDELYRLRLADAGVTTCKMLKREQYQNFISGLRKLPSVKRKKVKIYEKQDEKTAVSVMIINDSTEQPPHAYLPDPMPDKPQL